MTQDKRDLVLGGKSNLPAAIERRTRVANRILGELKQKDIEDFVKNYIEELDTNACDDVVFDEDIYNKAKPFFVRLLSYFYLNFTEKNFDKYPEFLIRSLINHQKEFMEVKIVLKNMKPYLARFIKNVLEKEENLSILDFDLIEKGFIALNQIEKNKNFIDFSHEISNILNIPIKNIRPYLRLWYNSARDAMEDAGLDITDMDSSDDVKEKLTTIDAEIAKNPR